MRLKMKVDWGGCAHGLVYIGVAAVAAAFPGAVLLALDPPLAWFLTGGLAGAGFQKVRDSITVRKGGM